MGDFDGQALTLRIEMIKMMRTMRIRYDIVGIFTISSPPSGSWSVILKTFSSSLAIIRDNGVSTGSGPA